MWLSSVGRDVKGTGLADYQFNKSITADQYIEVKRNAYKRAYESGSFFIKQIKEKLGVNVSSYDYFEFVKAYYNPDWGRAIPTTSSRFRSAWSYSVKTIFNFKKRYNNLTIRFIDTMIFGNTPDRSLDVIEELINMSDSKALSKCKNKSSVESKTNKAMGFRYSYASKIRFDSVILDKKIKAGLLETDYEKFYEETFGFKSEKGEYPAYRELMEFKNATRSPSLIKSYNYMLEFKKKYPNTAQNIEDKLNYNWQAGDPIWKYKVDEFSAQRNRDVNEYLEEMADIEDAQNQMTSMEVYAFNMRIAMINKRRDDKLMREYHARDAAEEAQVKTVVDLKKKAASTVSVRDSKLKKELINVGCRVSATIPNYLKYTEMLKSDMNLRSSNFADIISEGMIDVLNKIYPSSMDYFVKGGTFKYPLALDVMENVSWPNAEQWDNGFRRVIGWGTVDYAKKRLKEFESLNEEMARRNNELFNEGQEGVKVNKGYWKMKIIDSSPMFPFVGSFVKNKKRKHEFWSNTPREGYLEIEGLGFIDFSKVPAPINLGIDLEIDWVEKYKNERLFNYEIAKKRRQDKYKRSFWGKFNGAMTWVITGIGHIVKELNPLAISRHVLRSNPFTKGYYDALDEFTGGTLEGLHKVVQIPGRALKGERISKEDLNLALGFAMKAGVIFVSGGTASAIIAVSAGQLKNGTIGQTEFGNVLLRAAELGAYAYTAGQAADKLVTSYAQKEARQFAEVKALKASGLDKSDLGFAFGTAVFSTIGPGATKSFNLKEIASNTATDVATQKVDNQLIKASKGIYKGGYISKYSDEYLKVPGVPVPVSVEDRQISEAFKEIDVYHKKINILDDIKKGKIPSRGELGLLHDEGEAFYELVKDTVPAGQVSTALDIGFDIGLPKFNLPNLGLPDIDLPDFELPSFFKFDMPDLFKTGGPLGFRVPDLPSLGLSLPDLSIPGVKIPTPDLKKIVEYMMPRGVPLFPAATSGLDPGFFNFIDIDGRAFIRPALIFSPLEHAMLKYGLMPRRLTKAQLEYKIARKQDIINAVRRLKKIEDQQTKLLEQIYS